MVLLNTDNVIAYQVIIPNYDLYIYIYIFIIRIKQIKQFCADTYSMRIIGMKNII
jgi:hypothetical protein